MLREQRADKPHPCHCLLYTSTIRKGTKAPQAAGKIHSDIERGFIRAEVIAYDDMVKCGGVNAAKEKGLPVSYTHLSGQVFSHTPQATHRVLSMEASFFDSIAFLP